MYQIIIHYGIWEPGKFLLDICDKIIAHSMPLKETIFPLKRNLPLLHRFSPKKSTFSLAYNNRENQTIKFVFKIILNRTLPQKLFDFPISLECHLIPEIPDIHPPGTTHPYYEKPELQV